MGLLQVFLPRRASHPYSAQIFGCSSWTRLPMLWLRGLRSEGPNLIIHVIIVELTQHIRPRYINVSDGRTDGRTDGRMDGRQTTSVAILRKVVNTTNVFLTVNPTESTVATNITRKRLDQLASNIQGRCGVTMGRPD